MTDRPRAFATALERLRNEYAAAGKTDVAQALLPYLTESTDLPTYRTVAADLGLSEGAVKLRAIST